MNQQSDTPTRSPQLSAPDVPIQQSDNPGQATGIIAIILSFVGLAPFGIVLSVISTVQSKRAKASPTLGVIGIVINTVAMLTLAFLIVVFSMSHAEMQTPK